MLGVITTIVVMLSVVGDPAKSCFAPKNDEMLWNILDEK
jgi:hypothetical protein